MPIMKGCKTAVKAVFHSAHKKCRKGKQRLLQKVLPAVPDHNRQAPCQASDVLNSIQLGCRSGIMLDESIAKELKDVLATNKELQLEDAEYTSNIDAIDSEMLELHNSMCELEAQVEGAKPPASQPGSEPDSTQAKLSSIQTHMDVLEGRKNSLMDDLYSIRETQRQDLERAFAALESILDSAQPVTPPVTHARKAIHSTPAAPTKAEKCSEKTHDQRLADNDHQHSPLAPVQQTKAATVTSLQEALKDDYDTMKLVVQEAEQEFDARHDQFRQERAEFKDERDAGHEVGSVQDLDMQQLQETQRLTQALAEAEEGFYTAKEAALAAGVDLGDSDLSSGFRNNVDDGYRISEEKEMVEAVSPDKMKAWLDRLPDSGAASNLEQMTSQDVEIDDWDAKSVDIEDSISLVAEGSSRRRIDKWRAQLVDSLKVE